MPEGDCPSFRTSPRRRNGHATAVYLHVLVKQIGARASRAITDVAQNNENLLVDTAMLTATLCARLSRSPCGVARLESRRGTRSSLRKDARNRTKVGSGKILERAPFRVKRILVKLTGARRALSLRYNFKQAFAIVIGLT